MVATLRFAYRVKYKNMLTSYLSMGFTLIEVIIVLAIAGILASLAFPSYQDHVTHIHRNEGKTALLDLANQMENYYSKHHTYESAIMDQSSLSHHYAFSIIQATKTSYIIQATPTSADNHCQSLTLNQDGEKGISREATGTVEQCW